MNSEELKTRHCFYKSELRRALKSRSSLKCWNVKCHRPAAASASNLSVCLPVGLPVCLSALMANVAELLCAEPAALPLGDHLRATLCYFNTSLPFNLALPVALSLLPWSLSRLWLNLTFQGKVIITALLKLQIASPLLF